MISIGNYAFNKCISLKQIIIPASVKIIGNYAFSGCLSLIEILFENKPSISSIGNNAFSECSSLINIILKIILSMDAHH